MAIVLGIDAAWTIANDSGVALVRKTASRWQLLAVAESYGEFDLSPKFPPVLRRVLGLMFGLMRPVFPVPVAWRTRWA